MFCMPCAHTELVLLIGQHSHLTQLFLKAELSGSYLEYSSVQSHLFMVELIQFVLSGLLLQIVRL